MNTIITGKNFTVSEANKTYIEQKISSLTQLDATLISIRVEVDAEKKERENGKFRVEIWAEGRHSAKAGAHGYTFFDTLDAAMQKIKRQIIKLKDKKRPY